MSLIFLKYLRGHGFSESFYTNYRQLVTAPINVFKTLENVFCTSRDADTKRTKSKRFAFVPIIRGPNQNVLLWIKYNCSNLPKTISRPNQTALFRSRIFEPKRKRSGCEKTFFSKSKCFSFVPTLSGPNQNVLLSFQ